jgi:hypothetical protein
MGVRPRAALVNCICVRGNSVEDASWRAHSFVQHRHSCRCPPDAETSLGAAD